MANSGLNAENRVQDEEITGVDEIVHHEKSQVEQAEESGPKPLLAVPIDPEIEKRVVRKLDLYLTPLLALLCKSTSDSLGFSYLTNSSPPLFLGPLEYWQCRNSRHATRLAHDRATIPMATDHFLQYVLSG